jgi:hypothetical protein
MEEGILDIELMDRPLLRKRQCENGADNCGLGDMAESLVIINAGVLSETAKDPASLVPVKRAIWMKLVTKNPLASNNVDAVRARNQTPSVVGL